MATPPETRFYSAVHKLLPKEVHREKMHNPYRGGTADVWYSGNADDLWVEYKFLTKVPVNAPICMDKLLSPLQLDWLRRRYKEGRNVAVILGTPVGSWVFLNLSWEGVLLPSDLRANGITKQSVADFIRDRVMIR